MIIIMKVAEDRWVAEHKDTVFQVVPLASCFWMWRDRSHCSPKADFMATLYTGLCLDVVGPWVGEDPLDQRDCKTQNCFVDMCSVHV
jgi:hypothetical protein